MEGNFSHSLNLSLHCFDFFRQLIYALKLGLNALSPATPTAQICVVSVDQQVLYNVLTDLWREVPFEKMKPQPQ